jgi:hypothetical protein
MFKDIRGEFLSDEKLVQNVCVCVWFHLGVPNMKFLKIE